LGKKSIRSIISNSDRKNSNTYINHFVNVVLQTCFNTMVLKTCIKMVFLVKKSESDPLFDFLRKFRQHVVRFCWKFGDIFLHHFFTPKIFHFLHQNLWFFYTKNFAFLTPKILLFSHRKSFFVHQILKENDFLGKKIGVKKHQVGVKKSKPENLANPNQS